MTIVSPMPPRKKTTSTPKDRHYEFRWVRLRGVIANPSQEAADAVAMTFTEWVNQAVREKLEREGRWHPDKS